MIRLPPTSISLSESDIHLHFREISIYQSLLQQGFTKNAIQQYYASLRASEPADSSSSQHNPPLASTKLLGIDRERSIVHKASPVILRNLNSQTSSPIFPVSDSGDATSITSGRNRMPQDQSAESFLLKSTYGESASRSSTHASKRFPYDEAYEFESKFISASGEGTNIYETSDPCSTRPFAPSTVDLRAGARLGFEFPQPNSQDASDIYVGKISGAVDEPSHLTGQGNNDQGGSDFRSSPVATSINIPMRHRPRQSSMLRISRNAASPSSSAQSDDSFKSTVTKMSPTETSELKSPRPRTMTYRARSQTYSWIQSETDDLSNNIQHVASGESSPCSQSAQEELASTILDVRPIATNKSSPQFGAMQQSLSERATHSPGSAIIAPSHRQISHSSPLRPEAEDFVPLKLPSPFSATRRVSSGLNNLPTSNKTSSNITEHPMYARSSPNLPFSTPPRSSSIGGVKTDLRPSNTPSSDRDFPSSPPKSAYGERGNLLSKPGPSASSVPGERDVTKEPQTRDLPKTPRILARVQRVDGPGSVYDDRLPAHLQPKTPADLTRGFHITEREAAYTAPPGRTARTPATISQTLRSSARVADPGEESPSRRARTIRERRERELRRSAMMEEEIWGRLRELDADAVGGRMVWDRPGQRVVSTWRDDFGADRLGEENFDEDGRMRVPRVEPRGQGGLRGQRR